jgi:hypothetical protein
VPVAVTGSVRVMPPESVTTTLPEVKLADPGVRWTVKVPPLVPTVVGAAVTLLLSERTV